MKNVLVGITVVLTVFLFTACEKADLEGLQSTTTLTQDTEQAALKQIQNKTAELLELSTAHPFSPKSVSRTNQSLEQNYSMEDEEVGLSILVDGETVYSIPDCSVIITDKGDFETYTITAIDRFEEIENTVSYSLQIDVAKSDKTILNPTTRPYSIAWGQFSAWPVPSTFLFGYWQAEWVAEDAAQVVMEVPIQAPFSIYKQTIDINSQSFSSEEFEGIVRIVASKNTEETATIDIGHMVQSYPWLSDFLTTEIGDELPESKPCDIERIEVYSLSGYEYLFVTQNGQVTMYSEAGELYCTDTATYSCKDQYGLTNPSIVWSCE